MKQIAVLIEYSPTNKRVFVRAAWRGNVGDHVPYLKPLARENQQNYVKVFEGIDMGIHTGFSGLEQSKGADDDK